MARTPRATLPDGYFHAYSRGIASTAPLFRDDDDRTLFLELVRRTAVRHSWSLHAVCILSTHYHVVLEATRAQLSTGMHRLN